MNTTITIVLAVILFWIVLSWASYYLAGWHKWEKLFARKSKDVTMSLASSVYLRSLGGYNHCVRVGTDAYGVVFSMVKVLLFHKSFSVPWAQILSFEVTSNRMRSRCILHTTQGDIRIYGNMAEHVARECAVNYVRQT